MDALSGDKAPEVHWWLMKDHHAHCCSLPSTDATTCLTVQPRPICVDPLLILLDLFPRSRKAGYICSSYPDKYEQKELFGYGHQGLGQEFPN